MVLPLVPDRLVHVLEEEGSCDFAIDDPTHGRFRVNVSRQQTGYKACLRLITRELPTVESLRLPDGIAAAAHHHQGLIVFTGPTGHGKTTTMNAVVDLINRTTSHHVITVEDPVEHLHPKKSALMSQREVGTHTASFGSALKGFAARGPDVIVVGELRDVETVRHGRGSERDGSPGARDDEHARTRRARSTASSISSPRGPAAGSHDAGGPVFRLVVSQRLVPSKDGAGSTRRSRCCRRSVPPRRSFATTRRSRSRASKQRGKALGIVRLDESLVKPRRR